MRKMDLEIILNWIVLYIHRDAVFFYTLSSPHTHTHTHIMDWTKMGMVFLGLGGVLGLK